VTNRSGSENRRRNIVVTIRVDEDEKELLDQGAKNQGVSLPELLRSSAFHSIAGSQKSRPGK